MTNGEEQNPLKRVSDFEETSGHLLFSDIFSSFSCTLTDATEPGEEVFLVKKKLWPESQICNKGS